MQNLCNFSRRYYHLEMHGKTVNRAHKLEILQHSEAIVEVQK